MRLPVWLTRLAREPLVHFLVLGAALFVAIGFVRDFSRPQVRIDAEGNAMARPGRAGASSHTLYVLDEPTVGLHMADVEKLIRVLHRLVDAGNSVVVIEHNLDVMADADWIIDLGPEGGDAGGRVVFEAPPLRMAQSPGRSHTARALADFLEHHGSS